MNAYDQLERPSASRSLATVLAIALSSISAVFGSAAVAQTQDECAAVDLTVQPAEPVVIRYGLTGGGEEPLALLWADRASYPNNGRFYDLQPTLYQPTDRMAAFQAGQLEAGTISLPGLAAAAFRGINARAVATLVQVNEADNEGAFVTLSGSGITSAADLVGKRVGYYGPNTISEFWVRHAMRMAGADSNNVSFLALPPPAQEQALRNGQIDVAWMARQFLAQARAAGGVDVVMTPYQAAQSTQPSLMIFFSPEFVEAHPQAYCAWRADFQQALRTWGENREPLFPLLIAASYIRPSSATAGPDGGRSPGGAMSLADIDRTLQQMTEVGFLRPNMVRPASELVLPGYALIAD